MEHIIKISNLKYEYGDSTKALDGIHMKIRRGSKVAVLGSNGAGKSTLLLHLNGTLKPKSGKIEFENEPVRYDKRYLDYLRKQVGIIFQDPETQLFSASVYQDISFGPMNMGLSEAEVRKRVESAMDATGVTAFKHKPTHALSHGQKKRVTIADVAAMTPSVFILDEPTASLDPKHAADMMTLFEALNRQGKTMILSTHDVEEAWRFADYIFVLKDGRVYREGSPQEIFSDRALLEETNLQSPMIFEVYKTLTERGFGLHETSPRTKEELISYLKRI